MTTRETSRATGEVFVPTRADMEAELRGILVTTFENGSAIAITTDKRAALEALDTFYREYCDFANLLDDTLRPLTDAYYYLNTGYVQFSRTADGGWENAPVAASATDAVGVTWLDEPVEAPIPAPYMVVHDDVLWTCAQHLARMRARRNARKDRR